MAAQPNVETEMACVAAVHLNKFAAEATGLSFGHAFDHGIGTMMTGSYSGNRDICLLNPTYRVELDELTRQMEHVSWFAQHFSTSDDLSDEDREHSKAVEKELEAHAERSKQELAVLAAQILAAPAVSVSMMAK